MWSIETRWFDVAVVTSLFAVGSMLFGRFEEHKSRGRRLLKLAVVLTVTLVLAEIAGRLVAYGVLLVPLIGALYAHIYWLPKHGINGWTAEPRDRYLALIAERAGRPK